LLEGVKWSFSPWTETPFWGEVLGTAHWPKSHVESGADRTSYEVITPDSQLFFAAPTNILNRRPTNFQGQPEKWSGKKPQRGAHFQSTPDNTHLLSPDPRNNYPFSNRVSICFAFTSCCSSPTRLHIVGLVTGTCSHYNPPILPPLMWSHRVKGNELSEINQPST